MAKFDMTVSYGRKNRAASYLGTNPGMVTGVTDRVPDPGSFKNADDQVRRALQYMGLKAGTPIVDIPVDRVFIGFINSQLDDGGAAAHLVEGKRRQSIKQALIVPGCAASRPLPKTKASTRFSPKLDSSGAMRVAVCASA
jgi:3-isopropylmalate/(R)-2-methylmalate dehydratase large subunit